MNNFFKRKIIYTILITSVIMFLTLAACATSPQGQTTTVTQQAATSPKVFNLTVQSFAQPGTYAYEGVQKNFLNLIEKTSNGQVKFKLVSSGAIVPDAEVPNAVGQGVLDFGLTSSLYYAGAVPAAKFLYGYPGQYRDMRDCFVLRYLGLYDLMREIYGKKLVAS